MRDRQFGASLLLCCATLLALALVAQLPISSLSGPNHTVSPCKDCSVLLVVVDTLSAQHLKAYGYERDTMPRTEKFFRTHGVIFERAYAHAPWTLPSFMSMFFSDLPSRITYADLENGRTTLQSEVRAAGMHVRGMLIPPFFFITEAIAKTFAEGEWQIEEKTPENTEHENLGELSRVFTEWDTERNTTGIPFFGMLHTFLPHDPYDPAHEYAELFAQETAYPSVTLDDLREAEDANTPEKEAVFALRYDQEIRETDDLLGIFLDSLTPEQLAHTVIIVTSDHGEAFGEHGSYWHGQNLYDEVLHVPLFVYAPGVRPSSIAENIGLSDIAPTVLSLMGITVPETFIGSDLTEALYGNGSIPHRFLQHESGAPFFAKTANMQITQVGETPKKLAEIGAQGSPESIITPTSWSVRIGRLKMTQQEGRIFLFDTHNDPGETENRMQNIPLWALPEFGTLFRELRLLQNSAKDSARTVY